MSGSGSARLKFAMEGASWLEFDSCDLDDAAVAVTLALSAVAAAQQHRRLRGAADRERVRRGELSNAEHYDGDARYAGSTSRSTAPRSPRRRRARALHHHRAPPREPGRPRELRGRVRSGDDAARSARARRRVHTRARSAFTDAARAAADDDAGDAAAPRACYLGSELRDRGDRVAFNGARTSRRRRRSRRLTR